MGTSEAAEIVEIGHVQIATSAASSSNAGGFTSSWHSHRFKSRAARICAADLAVGCPTSSKMARFAALSRGPDTIASRKSPTTTLGGILKWRLFCDLRIASHRTGFVRLDS